MRIAISILILFLASGCSTARTHVITDVSRDEYTKCDMKVTLGFFWNSFKVYNCERHKL